MAHIEYKLSGLESSGDMDLLGISRMPIQTSQVGRISSLHSKYRRNERRPSMRQDIQGLFARLSRNLSPI